jgi:hypothetical protein
MSEATPAPDWVLTPERIRAALDLLLERGREAGLKGTIVIYGGAAIALLYPDDPATRPTEDVDAVFHRSDALSKIIAGVGKELQLSNDWLNSDLLPFLPHGRTTPSRGKLTIIAATPRELIATKMAAGRPQDVTDLAIIARHEGITDPQELVDIAFDAYGDDSVVLDPDRDDALLFAQAVIARARRGGG